MAERSAVVDVIGNVPPTAEVGGTGSERVLAGQGFTSTSTQSKFCKMPGLP